MRTKSKIHTITLTSAQEAALKEIATKNQTLSRSGITTGLPSWRALLCAIADGHLVIATAGAAPKGKKKERKKFRAHPRFAPRWWSPTEDDDMPTAAAVAASGYSVEELVAGGLLLLDEGDNLYPPINWSGWHKGVAV